MTVQSGVVIDGTFSGAIFTDSPTLGFALPPVDCPCCATPPKICTETSICGAPAALPNVLQATLNFILDDATICFQCLNGRVVNLIRTNHAVFPVYYKGEVQGSACAQVLIGQQVVRTGINLVIHMAFPVLPKGIELTTGDPCDNLGQNPRGPAADCEFAMWFECPIFSQNGAYRFSSHLLGPDFQPNTTCPSFFKVFRSWPIFTTGVCFIPTFFAALIWPGNVIPCCNFFIEPTFLGTPPFYTKGFRYSVTVMS